MMMPASPTGWHRNVKDVATPKLPPPPRSAQNRSGWLSASGSHETAVGEHDVDRHQVVDGKSEMPGQVAGAAAEGQAGDTRGRHEPRGRGQTESTGRVVDVAPCTAGVGADRAGRRVDGGRAQLAEVDHQGVVPHAEPRSVVATTPDREGHLIVACEIDAVDHVGDVGDPGDGPRVAVDGAVVDASGVVVVLVGSRDEPAAEPRVQLLDHPVGLEVGGGHVVSCCGRCGKIVP